MYNSDQNAVLAIHTVFPVLAIATTSLRFLARTRKSSAIGMDDWLVLLSTVLCVSLGVAVIYGVVVECFGVPVSTMSDDQYVCFGKILYAEPVVGLAALGVIKLSIVCFYKRIFTTRAFGITCNAFLALIICWTIGALVGQIFQLWPIYDNWSIEVSNADAPLNYPAFLMAIAVFDLAIDVAILCLPVRPTIKLQMSKKRKYSILGIFALGSLCCVAEAVRIYQQWEFLYAPSVADNPVVTDTGSLIQIVNWLTIEACLSTVAASLPTIGGLFVKSNSTESFVNRFRSFFSLPSRSILISERDSKRSKVSGEARTDDATRREWHELHLNSANKMAVEEERKF